jgi:uncharacterized protein
VTATISTPGVYVEFVDPPAELDPVAVDVAGFVGVFERGPLDRPVRIASWPQFEATFGTFVRNGIGAYALKGWLDNGGRIAHVVRVAAPPHATTLQNVAQPADRRSSIVIALDGFVVGAAAAVQHDGRTWMHLVAAVDPLTNGVTWDRPLHPDVDLTQLLMKPVHVAVGATAAEAMLFDDAATPVLKLRAASPGAWGNHLSILVQRCFGAATTNRLVPGVTGAATPVDSIDGFVVGDLVRITQETGGVVSTIRRVLTSIDHARAVLYWNAALTVVNPAQRLRLEAETFTLSVRERGRLREVFDGLSVVPEHPRFASNVLDRSAYVHAEVPTGTLPPPATGNPAVLDWVLLAAGRDGTAALALDDLLGDELVEDYRGLAAFARIDEPAIMAIPDLVAEPVPARIKVPPEVEVDPCLPCQPPAPPPDALVADISEASASFGDPEIALAQQALIDHCERRADRIALLDPPCGRRVLDVPAIATWRRRFDSTYAAMHAPWISVVDPLAHPVRLRRLPPSGHVAGLMARVDAERGPWLSPANRLLRWVHATDTVLDDTWHGVLNDADVDALRAQAGRGVAVLGARTVASDALWRFVATRRLFLMVERTLRVGLAWTVFEPAGPSLDRVMAAVIEGLLEDLWQRGAFDGESPQDAYFVKTGEGDRQLGQVIVEIGIAVARPAEVILLQVVRTQDRLEIREQPERSV